MENYFSKEFDLEPISDNTTTNQPFLTHSKKKKQSQQYRHSIQIFKMAVKEDIKNHRKNIYQMTT